LIAKSLSKVMGLIRISRFLFALRSQKEISDDRVSGLEFGFAIATPRTLTIGRDTLLSVESREFGWTISRRFEWRKTRAIENNRHIEFCERNWQLFKQAQPN
jgi:hypothetical protein